MKFSNSEEWTEENLQFVTQRIHPGQWCLLGASDLRLRCLWNDVDPHPPTLHSWYLYYWYYSWNTGNLNISKVLHLLINLGYSYWWILLGCNCSDVWLNLSWRWFPGDDENAIGFLQNLLSKMTVSTETETEKTPEAGQSRRRDLA